MDRNGYQPDGFDGGEASLDPPDWNAFRDRCVAELHGLIDHLATTADRPAWQPIPTDVKQMLAEPLPVEPQGTERVCDDIRESILPHTLGNTHPRFFGWVHGAGTAGGMLAELYAAAMNANLGGREHAPVYVERTVIDWCKQIFGFPDSASGLLLSGTSMANLVALAVARQQHCPTDVRGEGVASAPKPLVAYTSAESHCSVTKAMEFLGLGRKNLRRIPVNDQFQIDLAALETAVAADRVAGLQPFCVVGTAGTVNTAAIDELDALASFCQRESLWFHVDGAFGALAILSDECRRKLIGIERADSLAFDFHKWLHVPYDAGCVLVRDGEAHRNTFTTQANYLQSNSQGFSKIPGMCGGAAAGAPWFCEYGPELSRGFRALKVWFTIKEHGLRRLGEKIADNCRQARWLGELVDGHPRLERLAPVSLNIVCFRYVQPGMSAGDLDRFNAELVIAVQESGIAVPSTTRVDGKLAIRVNITNHRTRTSDLQMLVNAIDELAPSVATRIVPERPRRISKSDLLPAKLIESVCTRSELQLWDTEPVGAPTERLLTAGGDARLDIDPLAGMSSYGCRPRPVPGLASFGSCTATTITRQNFAAAEAVRQRLLSAASRGKFRKQFVRELESVKRELLELTAAVDVPLDAMSPFAPRKDAGAGNDSLAGKTSFRGAKGDIERTEILLCSSGTDAEIHAVCLVSAAFPGRLTNIVIAPDETGTGVPHAAAGRHFSTRTPLGVSVTKGARLAGLRDDTIDVVAIYGRDEQGNLRSPEQFDRDVESAVESAVRGSHCLLHVLDASKTGWGAPSLSLVRSLAERHGKRLTVVVDACQMRIDRRGLGDYLREGILVQITGSKTFGGPPFSGALLVPPRLAARFAVLDSLPAGILDYAAKDEWPADWKVTKSLRDDCNVGLLLRWTAALREMRSFYEVPFTARAETLRTLRDAVCTAMRDTPGVIALPSPVPDRGESVDDGWDAVQTIFPFQVRHRDEWLGGALLTHEQTKSLHHRLNTDLSSVPALRTSDRDRELAAFLCHIGQPVELCKTPGSRVSALRFCTGANVVSRIAFDASLGSNPDKRLVHERQRICRVFEKIGLILDHWNEIDEFERTAFSSQQSAVSNQLLKADR